jgi:hypothetical protein
LALEFSVLVVFFFFAVVELAALPVSITYQLEQATVVPRVSFPVAVVFVVFPAPFVLESARAGDQLDVGAVLLSLTVTVASLPLPLVLDSPVSVVELSPSIAKTVLPLALVPDWSVSTEVVLRSLTMAFVVPPLTLIPENVAEIVLLSKTVSLPTQEVALEPEIAPRLEIAPELETAVIVVQFSATVTLAFPELAVVLELTRANCSASRFAIPGVVLFPVAVLLAVFPLAVVDDAPAFVVQLPSTVTLAIFPLPVVAHDRFIAVV